MDLVRTFDTEKFIKKNMNDFKEVVLYKEHLCCWRCLRPGIADNWSECTDCATRFELYGINWRYDSGCWRHLRRLCGKCWEVTEYTMKNWHMPKPNPVDLLKEIYCGIYLTDRDAYSDWIIKLCSAGCPHQIIDVVLKARSKPWDTKVAKRGPPINDAINFKADAQAHELLKKYKKQIIDSCPPGEAGHCRTCFNPIDNRYQCEHCTNAYEYSCEKEFACHMCWQDICEDCYLNYNPVKILWNWINGDLSDAYELDEELFNALSKDVSQSPELIRVMGLHLWY